MTSRTAEAHVLAILIGLELFTPSSRAGSAPPVVVVVSASAERCGVGGININCVHVGRQLRDHLHVPSDATIVVSAEGAGDVATSHARKVAAIVKAAGYADVSTQ